MQTPQPTIQGGDLPRPPLYDSLLTALLRAFCPTPCAGCGAPDGPLCRRCHGEIRDLPGELRDGSGGPPHLSLGPYEGTLRAALHHAKFENCPSLAEFLATALVRRLLEREALLAGVHAVVPIPVSPGTRDHPTPALACALGRGAHLPVWGDVLTRRPTRQRTRWLGEAARPAHVARTLLGGRPPPVGRGRVILVDDLRTTGSTLRHARRLLGFRGLEVALELTLVRTPRVTLARTRRGPPESGAQLLSRARGEINRRPPDRPEAASMGPVALDGFPSSW